MLLNDRQVVYQQNEFNKMQILSLRADKRDRVLRKIRNMDLAQHVGNEVIEPVNVVLHLVVMFDQELFMKQHINRVTRNRSVQIDN